MTIDSDLIAEAQSLSVNLSRSAEEGIRKAVAAAKSMRWKEENASAIEDANAWVGRNGLPLAKHRVF
ncbi:MAG: type II toxin-antitoxin system CcdA family antitoxin [Rhizobiaceae bacterium]